MKLLKDLKTSVLATLVLTVLLCGVYPLVVFGIGQLLFPKQANGSLVRDASGQVVGSALIAQAFAKDEYLHPRPSAAGNGYDPTSSGGSNLGPLDPALAKRIAGDAATLRASTGHQEIPDDAITTSGSGLDPDISPAYALLQVNRIAKARGIDSEAVEQLISKHIEPPFLGFIGQPHVNVLMTNRALDASLPKAQPRKA